MVYEKIIRHNSLKNQQENLKCTKWNRFGRVRLIQVIETIQVSDLSIPKGSQIELNDDGYFGMERQDIIKKIIFSSRYKINILEGLERYPSKSFFVNF